LVELPLLFLPPFREIYNRGESLKTRLALIGCGGMSRAHAARFEASGSRLEVVAVVDVDAAKAQVAAEHLGARHVATDFREVLPQVDAVLLALPHHLHHAVGMACLEAGKHVLMEKPLANSQAECLDLIGAAENSGKVLMVAYCMRFHPLVEQMKKLIAEKTYGETFQISIWTEQLTRYADGHWAHSAATLGGGQFFSHGCHYVDLLLWFLGEPVRGTHLGTNFGTPWMEKEGTSHVSIQFANGAIGYHQGTWGARGTRLRNSMHVHTTEGMIEFTPDRDQLLFHRGAREDQPGGVEVLAQVEGGKHLEREMEHFLDCIETGSEPLTNAQDSLQGLRVIWKLYEAEENNIVADLRGLCLAT
jgi:predicted dehydrogenase